MNMLTVSFVGGVIFACYYLIVRYLLTLIGVRYADTMIGQGIAALAL